MSLGRSLLRSFSGVAGVIIYQETFTVMACFSPPCFSFSWPAFGFFPGRGTSGGLFSASGRVLERSSWPAYKIQIAPNESFEAPVIAGHTDVTRYVALHALPPGSYFLSVRQVADDQKAGEWSAPSSLVVGKPEQIMEIPAGASTAEIRGALRKVQSPALVRFSPGVYRLGPDGSKSPWLSFAEAMRGRECPCFEIDYDPLQGTTSRASRQRSPSWRGAMLI